MSAFSRTVYQTYAETIMSYGDIVGGYYGKINDALLRLTWSDDADDSEDTPGQS